MLKELEKAEQKSGDPGFRRWFADEEMDLVVWYSTAGEITGFQLCYDKTGDEHAFTWRASGYLSHAAVDQGEELPTDNRSPILASDGKAPLRRVLREFKARSGELEPSLAGFVRERLRSFGR